MFCVTIAGLKPRIVEAIDARLSHGPGLKPHESRLRLQQIDIPGSLPVYLRGRHDRARLPTNSATAAALRPAANASSFSRTVPFVRRRRAAAASARSPCRRRDRAASPSPGRPRRPRATSSDSRSPIERERADRLRGELAAQRHRLVRPRAPCRRSSSARAGAAARSDRSGRRGWCCCGRPRT